MDDAGPGEPQYTATAARIYDFLLGGVHNFPADREVAQTVIASFPMARAGIYANRAFLRRAVRELTAAGLRQFLDIGSGIPTVGNVHEISQSVSPDARVVYVDKDPVAVSESMSILDGNQNALAIRGDFLEPQGILAHPQVRELLDFDRPVVVLLVALLHFVADDEAAYAAVDQIRDALAPGSYLVLTHVTDEGQRFNADDVRNVEDAYRQRAATTGRLRSQKEIARYFDGWELVEPGLTWVPSWRPDAAEPDEFTDDPQLSMTLAGVARIP
jgi:SAM-dependent methyltransferase